jgi:hypothetical protein
VPSPSTRTRPLAYLPLVISALCAVIVGQMAWHDPRYLFPLAAMIGVSALPAVLARRRMKRLLMSGDVKRVLGTWEGSIDRVMYPETIAPLMAATAYAAYGWTDAARASLSRAVKGPAWEAALEQRLFVEALLDTFEGERATAMQKADVLERLPIPPAGPLARLRIARLRRGIGAMARAFAHKSKDCDLVWLRRAAAASPLVHWAMRYAGAVVAIDKGDARGARDLLDGAPSWPKESAFRVFHEELSAYLV